MRRAARLAFLLVAVVLLLAEPAFADEALPSFIQVSKKYNFYVGVDPIMSNKKTTAWLNMIGTVTELDTAGWLTIKTDSGVRHLNMRQVLFVTEAP